MAFAYLVVLALAGVMGFVYHLVNWRARPPLTTRERVFILGFASIGFAMGAAAILSYPPIPTDDRLLNLLAYGLMLLAIIAVVYWRAVVALAEAIITVLQPTKKDQVWARYFVLVVRVEDKEPECGSLEKAIEEYWPGDRSTFFGKKTAWRNRLDDTGDTTAKAIAVQIYLREDKPNELLETTCKKFRLSQEYYREFERINQI